MKKFILILLLLAGAGYAYWPYYSTGQFVNALNNEDAKSVDNYVDWPSVHSSIKEQMRTQMDKGFDEFIGKVGIKPDVIKVAALKGAMDKALDLMIEQMVKQFNSETFVKTAKKREGKPDVEKVELESRSWISATEFKTTVNVDETVLKFRLKDGNGWKLVEMTLPEEILKKFKDGFSRELQTRAAMLTRAVAPGQPIQPGAAQQPPPKKEQWIFKDYQNPLDKRPKSTR
jgi:hypothetical protein